MIHITKKKEHLKTSHGMMETLTTFTKSQPIHGPSPTQWSSSKSRRPVIKSLSDLDTFICRPCNNYFKNPQCFKFHRDWHRGDLNHKCPECTKTFKGRCEVNRHMVPIHGRPLGDKEETLHKKGDPVQKLETKKFDYSSIKENCEIDTSNFQCASCDYNYPERNDLIIHIKEKHVKPSLTLTNESDFSVNSEVNLLNATPMKMMSPLSMPEVMSSINPHTSMHQNSTSELPMQSVTTTPMLQNSTSTLPMQSVTITPMLQNPTCTPASLPIQSVTTTPMLQNSTSTLPMQAITTTPILQNPTSALPTQSVTPAVSLPALSTTFDLKPTISTISPFEQYDLDIKGIQNQYLKNTQDQNFTSQALKCDMFKTKQNISAHISSICDGKSFECDRCSAKLKTKPDLNRHIQTVHEGKKPFKCDICDVCFTRKSSLNTHISSIHEGQKFKCDICSAKFNFKRSLKRHVETVHEGKKSFICDISDDCFTLKSSLNNHISSIHEGKKPMQSVTITPMLQNPTYTPALQIQSLNTTLMLQNSTSTLPMQSVTTTPMLQNSTSILPMQSMTTTPMLQNSTYALPMQSVTPAVSSPALSTTLDLKPTISTISPLEQYGLDIESIQNQYLKNTQDQNFLSQALKCDMCLYICSDLCTMEQHLKDVHIEKSQSISCKLEQQREIVVENPLDISSPTDMNTNDLFGSNLMLTSPPVPSTMTQETFLSATPVESKHPKEEPEKIEPEGREETLTYDHCVIDPETSKLIKLKKTFPSVTPPMIDMPSLIESKLPKEEPEEIEPEEREETRTYDNCLIDPETGKLTKIIKTFPSVTPPMIDMPSLIEPELPKEEPEEMEPEERDRNCVIKPETGKLIEPECQSELKRSPELNTNKKESQFPPQEKSSRFLFQCELCNLSFEHEQDFHVHKWVHEFKTAKGSELLNDFNGLSTKPVILDKIKMEDEIRLVSDDPMMKQNSIKGLNNHSGQKFENEISCMIEKQERWKNLSRELFKSLPKDFVSEFFSELPIIVASGNSKAIHFSCDLCPMTFDSDESLNNHRTRFCKSEVSSMREMKFLWKRLTINLSMSLQKDFFLNFISKLFIEANDKIDEKAAKVEFEEKSGKTKENDQINLSGKDDKQCEKNDEITSHSCLLCNKKFLSTEKLKTHIMKNHENGRHKCSMCNAGFSWASNLKKHIEKEHPISHSCLLCNKKFRSKEKLKAHITRNHENGTYKCSMCSAGFSWVSNLKKHTEKEHPISHSCLLCNKIFLSYEGIKAHLVKNHENGTYKCSMCNAGFSLVLNLKNHIEKEHGNEESPYGSKILNTSSKGQNEIKLQADLMSTAKVADDVNEIISEQSKLVKIDSGIKNGPEANMSTQGTDSDKPELCQKSQEKLKQKNGHKKITDIDSDKEKDQSQSSMDFSTCFSFSKVVIDKYSTEKQKKFDEAMEFFENMEFDENVEFDENMEFGENMECGENTQFFENLELDDIENEDTIDALDDLTSMLEIPDIFPNEEKNENRIQEKAMNKSDELGIINRTDKHTITSKIVRNPASSVNYSNSFDKCGQSMKSEDTQKKNESSDKLDTFENDDSVQECEKEISCMLEKWKNLSTDLSKSLSKDFFIEFFSELPNTVDSLSNNGNLKATKFVCYLCPLKFDSDKSLNNHRTMFCKTEDAFMREEKFQWKRLTIDLYKSLPKDFFVNSVNFISELFLKKLNSLYHNLDDTESDFHMKEVHEKDVRLETEAIAADSLNGFDLSENLINSEDQLEVETKEKVLKTYSGISKERTANPESHKHTSACYASKWGNHNSSLCPLVKENKLEKPLDEFLNISKKDIPHNSLQNITKIDEKAAMVRLEEKSEKIEEIDQIKNIETNENELGNLPNQCEEDPLLNSPKYSIIAEPSNDKENNENLDIRGNTAVENQNRKCDNCFATFGTYDKLKSHLVKGCKVVKCEVCKQTFSRRSNLNKHVRENRCPGKKKETVSIILDENSPVEKQNHKCEYCLKTFGTSSNLNRHLTNSCKDNPKNKNSATLQNKRYSKRLGSADTFHKCSKCKLTFSKEAHLIHHQRKKHEMFKEKKRIKKIYRCKYCEKKIANRFTLNRHFQKTCTSDPKRFELIPQMRIESLGGQELSKIYKCRYCCMPFAFRFGLRKHLRLFCTSDPNRFEYVSEMKIEHETILKEEERNRKIVSEFAVRFQCKKCDKSFSREEGLNRHLLVHDKNRKKYDCSLCDKKFVSQQVVDKHISSVHEGKKPHLCSQCGFSCADKGIMKYHIAQVHEGKKPYPCNQCDRMFSHKYEVKRHVSTIHEKNKPYQCSVCLRCFATNKMLKIHGDVHTDIRPYSCTICEDNFKRSHHLVTHLKTIHDVVKKDWKI